MIIDGRSNLNMTNSVVPKARSGKLTLKAIADRKFGNLAMIQKLNHRGYYVMSTRQIAYPPSWRWRIMRRGKPMGVRIEGGGFSTYDAARLACKLALADFLEQLELEKLVCGIARTGGVRGATSTAVCDRLIVACPSRSTRNISGVCHQSGLQRLDLHDPSCGTISCDEAAARQQSCKPVPEKRMPDLSGPTSRDTRSRPEVRVRPDALS
jgi:hypothetical protein